MRAKKSARKERKPWPAIREVAHKSGAVAWMVDARLRGKGERHFFKTKGEAVTKAEHLRITVKNEGTSGLVELPSRLRAEALDCSGRLAEVGATITDATDYYLSHARPPSGHRTVAALVAEFLTAKENAGRKRSYLDVQRYVLGSVFGRAFGERLAHEVGHTEIEKWMDGQTWAARTRKNYHADLRNLFAFAVKRGFCASNPIARLEDPEVTPSPPGILTVEQAAALLAAAENAGAGMLPPIAIGLFCGVRSAELEQLDWRRVRLDERTIEITAEHAKTRERRIVEMSENLVQWLLPHAKVAGRVAPPKSFDYHLSRVRIAAGISEWPKNALRHSFASYHLAHHRNAPNTASQLGHQGSTRTLFNSYRELVRPSDAKRFWELAPEPSEKVVEMHAA